MVTDAEGSPSADPEDRAVPFRSVHTYREAPRFGRGSWNRPYYRGRGRGAPNFGRRNWQEPSGPKETATKDSGNQALN